MLEAENWAECYEICKNSAEDVISKLLSHDKVVVFHFFLYILLFLNYFSWMLY